MGVKKPLLVLFDGNALVHRAYHALPPLTVARTGEVVNAIYGFTLMLLKAVNDLKPTHWAVAFDKAAPTFRHEMYDGYKIHRPATPDELRNQLQRVRQLVRAFNIPVFELDGYEADDILGTLSRQASEAGIDTVIVTGDADAMQLVSPRVKVLYPKPRGTFSNTILYDEAAVREKYGFEAKYVADYKALTGDPSDNIPGVRGIGDKTATKLIQQFGSIEQIYARVDEVTPSKVQELLRQNEAQAMRSKELATIVTEAPCLLDIEACRVSRYDRSQVADLLRELEFFSLLARLPETEALAPEAPPAEVKPLQGDYRKIENATALAELAARLKGSSSFAFDVIGNNLDAMSAEPLGISICVAPGEAWYVPVAAGALAPFGRLPFGVAVEALSPFLENGTRSKLAHSGKYAMVLLAEHGVNIKSIGFDTMIAAHLLGEKSLTLKAIAFGRLGVEIEPVSEAAGKAPVESLELDVVAKLAGGEVDAVRRLADLLEADLRRQELWKLFSEVEMPLVPVLAHMERSGVALDVSVLREMSETLGRQLVDIEREIYRDVGHEFNINSHQQLSAVLFEELHLPAPRKTRGIYSTGAAVLEELRGVHPIIDRILEYRQLAKIKSTYIDALPGLVNPRTRRLHTSFHQTRTATGRLSSTDPNLQNIPVRGDLGRKVREAFIAPPGTRLLAADYSQIDLRVLAHISQDPRLLEAFQRDEDIHAVTAAQLFNVDKSSVTADMRRLAKTVNFGVIYGMSGYGLEQATELSHEQANEFIAAYFEKHPKVREYVETTKRQARDTGYVQTLLGRRRWLPEIKSSNRIVREAAERMAINMPVQGTSADIIKVAMIDLYNQMQTRKLRSKMLLQVHDELVFEVPHEEMELMQRLVPDIMANAVRLSVPVKVDIKSGVNWGEMG